MFYEVMQAERPQRKKIVEKTVFTTGDRANVLLKNMGETAIEWSDAIHLRSWWSFMRNRLKMPGPNETSLDAPHVLASSWSEYLQNNKLTIPGLSARSEKRSVEEIRQLDPIPEDGVLFSSAAHFSAASPPTKKVRGEPSDDNGNATSDSTSLQPPYQRILRSATKQNAATPMTSKKK